MAAGDERDGLFVVHRHAGERFANVAGGGDGIGVSVGSLGVHVDETHLNGAEWVVELAVAGVALVAQPRALGTPVGFIGLPDVDAAAAKTEGLEAHGLQGRRYRPES